MMLLVSVHSGIKFFVHSFYKIILFHSISQQLFMDPFHSVSMLKVWRLSTLHTDTVWDVLGYIVVNLASFHYRYIIFQLQTLNRRSLKFCGINKPVSLLSIPPHLLNRLQENTGDSYCSILPSVKYNLDPFLV